MRVKYLSAKDFLSRVQPLTVAGGDVEFRFNKEGFEARALDPSRVLIVEVRIPAEEFEEYDVDEDVGVGVNIDKFVRFLKRGKKGDSIVLESKDNLFDVVFEGKSRRRFRMGVVDVSDKVPEFPSLDFKVTTILDADVFFDAIKDVSMVADSVRLVAEKKGLKAIGVGSTSETVIEFDAPVEGEGKALYSVSYLMEVLKLLKGAEVVLKFFDGGPLYIEAHDGVVKILLAPMAE